MPLHFMLFCGNLFFVPLQASRGFVPCGNLGLRLERTSAGPHGTLTDIWEIFFFLTQILIFAPLIRSVILNSQITGMLFWFKFLKHILAWLAWNRFPCKHLHFLIPAPYIFICVYYNWSHKTRHFFLCFTSLFLDLEINVKDTKP